MCAPQVNSGTALTQRLRSFAINAWKGGLDRAFLRVGGKVSAMQTFLIMLLIWITPSFLFVGWRLWMSRPLRDVHYRHRWESSHALTGPLRRQSIHFHDR